MNFKRLKVIMKKKKISEELLSQLSGIVPDELHKKITGQAEFTLWEINRISDILSLNNREIINIFFRAKVS